MTNKNRKDAIRAYMTEHAVTYAAARRALQGRSNKDQPAGVGRPQTIRVDEAYSLTGPSVALQRLMNDLIRTNRTPDKLYDNTKRAVDALLFLGVQPTPEAIDQLIGSISQKEPDRRSIQHPELTVPENDLSTGADRLLAFINARLWDDRAPILVIQFDHGAGITAGDDREREFRAELLAALHGRYDDARVRLTGGPDSPATEVSRACRLARSQSYGVVVLDRPEFEMDRWPDAPRVTVVTGSESGK